MSSYLDVELLVMVKFHELYDPNFLENYTLKKKMALSEIIAGIHFSGYVSIVKKL